MESRRSQAESLQQERRGRSNQAFATAGIWLAISHKHKPACMGYISSAEQLGFVHWKVQTLVHENGVHGLRARASICSSAFRHFLNEGTPIVREWRAARGLRVRAPFIKPMNQ